MNRVPSVAFRVAVAAIVLVFRCEPDAGAGACNSATCTGAEA